jgi:hypothetical protein
MKLCEKKNYKSSSKTEVRILCIPFKYEFQMGSSDSLKLLDNFSESNTEEFVLSPWREVVKYKWKRGKFALLTFAWIYWFFMISCTLSVIFNPKSVLFQNMTVSLLCIILFYEITQITSYLVYSPLK